MTKHSPDHIQKKKMATRPKKKILLWFLMVAFALIFISFLVPEYPERPESSTRELALIQLNDSGDRLLVRTLVPKQRYQPDAANKTGNTVEYDYEFELPANHINEAISTISRTAWIPFIRLYVNPNGDAKTTFEIVYGHYNDRISDEEAPHLKSLGFSPTQTSPAENNTFEILLNLSGKQYPANSRGQYTGVKLTPPFYRDDITVTFDDPKTLERNRRINAVLRPLIALKEGVLYTFIVIIALFFILLGGHPFPSG